MVLSPFFLLGISGIKEIFQTVDSGQVENTRWSETSSGVLKVRLFSLETSETGDIVGQLCNKAVNWLMENFLSRNYI